MHGGVNSSAQMAGPLAMPGTTKDLALAYNSNHGAFRPAPLKPKPLIKSPKSARILQQAAGQAAVTPVMQMMLKDLESANQGLDGSVLEVQLLRHFRMARRFHDNKLLRRQKQLLQRQLKAFQAHVLSGSRN